MEPGSQSGFAPRPRCARRLRLEGWALPWRLPVCVLPANPLSLRVPGPHAPLAGGVEWTVSRLAGSSFHVSTLPLHLGLAEESLGQFSTTTSQPQREGHISELKDTQAPPAGWPWQFWQLEKGMKETTSPSTLSPQNISPSSRSWFPKVSEPQPLTWKAPCLQPSLISFCVFLSLEHGEQTLTSAGSLRTSVAVASASTRQAALNASVLRDTRVASWWWRIAWVSSARPSCWLGHRPHAGWAAVSWLASEPWQHPWLEVEWRWELSKADKITFLRLEAIHRPPRVDLF